MSCNNLRGRLFRLTPNHFGTELTLEDFLENHVKRSKLVILGEIHGVSPIISLQKSIQTTLADNLTKPLATSATTCTNNHFNLSLPNITDSAPKLRIVMEHFSIDMQSILNQYQTGRINAKELQLKYKEIGTEGHDINPYLPALEHARQDESNRINLYGGIIPRTYARWIMKEPIERFETILDAAKSGGYIHPNENLQGTESHYNFFESLLTGRNIFYDGSQPTDRFRQKMFPAQVLKDASMAYTVQKLLHTEDVSGHDRMLVVCGIGHMLYSHGVPERIFTQIFQKDDAINTDNDDNSNLDRIKNKTLRVACVPMPSNTNEIGNDDSNCAITNSLDASNFDTIEFLQNEYGSMDAADICFVYQDIIDSEEDDNEGGITDHHIREETRSAYDQVGKTAGNKGGDVAKAHGILSSLYYTPEEIEFIGETDMVNYQGVGCPHRHANLQEGEKVLDMGSGLGVDSFLATRAVGTKGRVVGIDLSAECVNHANRRAKARGIDTTNLSFIQSPIESIGSKIADKIEMKEEEVAEGHFDACISNGAFCLLPNKQEGFSECFRLLKSGGRIIICTTVLKEKLEDNIEWPLCMQTFAKAKDIEPMLQQLGFEDIVIDYSDSVMEVEVEVEDDINSSEEQKEEVDEGNEGGRFKVHNEEGRAQYQHLDNYSMNDLCARVVIKARKP